MRCDNFVKRAANGSSNDSRDQVTDRASDLRSDCLIISTVYHWQESQSKEIKTNFKKTQLLFNLTRTRLVTRT